jgi:hypothetical protein
MRNFGKIKNAFKDILAESISDKNVEKRKVVKRFIKAISESKILKAQFLIYNNIETRVDENQFSANLFITENIKILDKFKKEEILAENTKLVNLSQMVASRIDGDYDNKELHESITYLIFKETTPTTIQEVTKCRMALVDYISENKAKVIVETPEVPTSMLANIAVDRFNERYADLTEDEHKVLNVILEAGNSDGKEKVFKETIMSCIDSVNARIEESTNKEKLLNVKERLLSTKYISETFTDDITKLLDLKRTLTLD